MSAYRTQSTIPTSALINRIKAIRNECIQDPVNHSMILMGDLNLFPEGAMKIDLLQFEFIHGPSSAFPAGPSPLPPRANQWNGCLAI